MSAVDAVPSPPHRCEECGQEFYFAPRFHECPHKGDPEMLAAADSVRGESWADECLRRVMAPRSGR